MIFIVFSLESSHDGSYKSLRRSEPFLFKEKKEQTLLNNWNFVSQFPQNHITDLKHSCLLFFFRHELNTFV